MTNDPKLSIVIPVYNSENTIENTMNSLVAIEGEHRSAVQIICSDDGSTDRSVEIVKQFAHSHSEFRWNILEHRNTGVSGARNRALDGACGQWILFLDADDELGLDPIPFLDKAEPKTTSLYFPVQRQFHSNGRRSNFPAPRIPSDRVFDLLSSVVPLHICAAVFRRECASKKFDESLKYLEDWMYWWQNHAIFENGERIQSATPLAIVHVHQSNRTGAFAATGAARHQLANKILQSFRLTKKQKNNLKMQRDIGLFLQGKSTSFGGFFRFPCSPVLWIKYLLYGMFRTRIAWIHPYQQQKTQSSVKKPVS